MKDVIDLPPNLTPRLRVLEFLSTLVLVLSALFFIWMWSSDLRHNFTFSTLLILIRWCVAGVFFFFRYFPKSLSVTPAAWITAFLGMVMPFQYHPMPPPHEDNLLGLVLQCSGLTVQIISLISLNRSFGVVAANRGIKTRGAYRLVRHPLYLGYDLNELGLIINNFTWWNVCVFVATFSTQVVRIFEEEKILLRDSSYAHYAQKVRFRLIPFVF